jgi:hypothetical protein
MMKNDPWTLTGIATSLNCTTPAECSTSRGAQRGRGVLDPARTERVGRRAPAPKDAVGVTYIHWTNRDGTRLSVAK